MWADLAATARAGKNAGTHDDRPGNACPNVRKWPHVAGEKVSRYGVLRVGLRTLVVALDPLFCRPLAHPYCGRRAFSGGAARAGAYRRQERRGGVTATDGALARRAPMVCRGAPAPHRGHPYGGGAQRLLAGCRAHLLRGRVGWLVELLDDVLPLAPR